MMRGGGSAPHRATIDPPLEAAVRQKKQEKKAEEEAEPSLGELQARLEEKRRKIRALEQLLLTTANAEIAKEEKGDEEEEEEEVPIAGRTPIVVGPTPDGLPSQNQGPRSSLKKPTPAPHGGAAAARRRSGGSGSSALATSSHRQPGRGQGSGSALRPDASGGIGGEHGAEADAVGDSAVPPDVVAEVEEILAAAKQARETVGDEGKKEDVGAKEEDSAAKEPGGAEEASRRSAASKRTTVTTSTSSTLSARRRSSARQSVEEESNFLRRASSTRSSVLKVGLPQEVSLEPHLRGVPPYTAVSLQKLFGTLLLEQQTLRERSFHSERSNAKLQALVQSQEAMGLEEKVAALEAENQEYARKCPSLERLWRQYNEPFLKRAIELKERNRTMVEELREEFVIRQRDADAFEREHERYKRASWRHEGLMAQADELRGRIREAEVFKMRDVLPVYEESRHLVAEIQRRQAATDPRAPPQTTAPRRSARVPSQTNRSSA